MCSQCKDISSYLDFDCIRGTVDWTLDLVGGYDVEHTYPNATMCGYFLNLASISPRLMMSGYLVDPINGAKSATLLGRNQPMISIFDKKPVYGNGSIHFPQIRSPIADVLVVSAADGVRSVHDHVPFVAQECVLSWCVESIKSSYDSGSLNEEIMAVTVNTTVGNFPWSSVGGTTEADAGAWINCNDNITIKGSKIDWSSIPAVVSSHASINIFDRTDFGLSTDTAYAVMSIFDDAFPSFYVTNNDSSNPLLRYQTYLAGPVYIREIPFNPWVAPNNVTTHVSRLATAMTNTIRTGGSEDGGREIPGAAYRREVYVQIQ